ncbi:MAG: DciA family protein [Pseudomonadota bacterium]
MRKKSKQALKDKKILGNLNAQYIKNNELLLKICSNLPEEFRSNISQCSFYQNTLTIMVSNQLIASKLRYCLPQLKKKLQTFDFFCSLRKIRLQINTAITADNKNQAKNFSKPVYSDKTADLLLSLSNTIANPALQTSLKKLARHIKVQDV